MINQISINNSDKQISVSDIDARIEVLIDERDIYYTGNSADWQEEPEAEELDLLIKLREDVGDDGEILVRDNYWREYVRDVFYGDIDHSEFPDILWENIDWQGVADDESSAHTSIDFDGVNYYVV